MIIAALQLDITWEDREANYWRVQQLARRSLSQKPDLIVLPEMFATGFSMSTQVTAEPMNGPSPTFVRELAKSHGVAVIGGFALDAGGGKTKNCALAVDAEGRDLAVYAKTHLFSFMGEDDHHEAGAGLVPFKLGKLRCACVICYDLRFPELLRDGAEELDAVFVIASWPAKRRSHWDALLPARAVENQLYVIGVNRVGQGGGLDYDGGTAIYHPLGHALARADGGETIVTADVHAEEVDKVRKAMPFLKDRRF